MRYKSSYQKTHDIDWFFIFQDIPVHVGSNGGVIPDSIDCGDNLRFQKQVYSRINQYSEVPIIVEIDNLREYVPELFIEDEDDYELRELLSVEGIILPYEVSEYPLAVQMYCKSFVDMAKLGFVSMYRYDDDNLSNDHLIIIAKPVECCVVCEDLDFSKLPTLAYEDLVLGGYIHSCPELLPDSYDYND